MRRIAAGCLAGVLSACATFPGAGGTGRRVAADLFVVATAPLQVPVMAARDAWTAHAAPAARALGLVPWFAGRLLWHTGLTSLHLLDLTAAPLHVFRDDVAPVRIYRPYRLPMRRDLDADLGGEVADVLLWSAGAVGGTAVAWWFGFEYLPRALSF